jgi:ribosomal protein L15E
MNEKITERKLRRKTSEGKKRNGARERERKNEKKRSRFCYFRDIVRTD